MSSGQRLRDGADFRDAATRGDVRAVRTLLSGSAESVADLINSADGGGTTALQLASQVGHLEVVRLLLEKGAAILASNEQGNAALHMASQQGYPEVVQLLLEKGADTEAKNQRGKTPVDLVKNDATREVFGQQRAKAKRLRDAVTRNDVEAVRKLLSGSTASVTFFINRGDENGMTALHKATANRLLQMVQLLLDEGVDVKAQDQNGNTALHLASVGGPPEVVQLLLEREADACVKNKYGHTPLDAAKDDATREVFRQFSARVAKKKRNKKRNKKRKGKAAVDADSDSDAPDEGPDDVKESGSSSPSLTAPGSALPLPPTVVSSSSATAAAPAPLRPPLTPQEVLSAQNLFSVAGRGDMGAVRTLLNRPAGIVAAFINVGNENGVTALSMASNQGHQEVVRLLVEKGADIETKGQYGYTAMHGASGHGWIKVVRLLLEKGANLQTKADDGATALHLSSHKGHPEVVRLLLEKGADIAAKNQRGTTALHMASQQGHLEVVRLLLKKGADIQTEGKEGFTALYFASHSGHREVVRLLLVNGADTEAKDKQGATALHRASQQGYPEVVELLLEKGAGTEAKDQSGRTPLDLAQDNATREVFRQFSARVAKKKNKKKKSRAAVDAPNEGPAPPPTSDDAAAEGGAVLAQRLQRVFRGRRVRRGLNLGALRRTRDERQGRRAFDSRWSGVVEGVGRARGGRGGSGTELGEFRWEDEKAKYDMVLDRGSIEGEGEGEGGGWDCRALQQILEDVAFTSAPPSSSSSSSSAWEALPLPTGTAGSGAGPKEGGEEEGQELEEGQVLGPIINEIELAHSVVRWLEGADTVHRGMFYSRMRMLASDHRSYAYSKRLVGSSVPLLETKLDRGMRILWSQLRRGREKPAIIIWFVAKHDRVPRCMELVSRCFRYRDWGQEQAQTQTQGQTQIQGQKMGVEEGGEGEVVELGEDESLLDPVGNAPLKTYTLDLQAQAQAHSSSGGDVGSGSGKKLPLRLSKREREVNLAVGTVLLLGRSGTGKTVCLCNRMASDRQSNPLYLQLFVCRSRRLRDAVQQYQRDYGNLDGNSRDSGGKDGASGASGGKGGGSGGMQSPSLGAAAFLTLEALLDAMESRVLGAADAGTDTATDAGTATGVTGSGSGTGRTYLPSKRVDFKRFKEQIFPSFGKPKLDPLVAWTQIRSFIKGSVEALLVEGTVGSSTSSSSSRALSLPAYLALAKGRCRLQPPERAEAYAVYVQYEALLLHAGLWDDCDRVMHILLAAGLHLPLGKSGRNGGGGGGGGGGFEQMFDKVYVDEVQDSSQIEIALYFLAAGMRYDRLFLAGDPAQSIVEGIDFRFEEVRGIVHALSEQTVNIPRPVTLITNYRCHAGILNCASGVLDLLLSTFPHAADKLPRDQGLCGGPRPEYFADTGAGSGAGAGAGAGAFLRRLLQHNPRIVVLCRDEQFQDGESLFGSELSQLVPEETLALGIRASKGMEFPDVLLLNFFCDLPAAEQRAWKLRLIDGEKDGPNIPPQMETQLKLLYTAVTRSCARLIFAETRSSAAGDAFFRWLEGQQLAERMAVKREQGAGQEEGKEGEGEGREYLSNDEWRARGIQLAMSNGGIPVLRNAAKCFQRAGDKAQNLLERVLLQEQVERAREGFSAALGDAETLTPAHEAELAALVLRCVELQLYQDGLDLGSLLLPHLPAQSQALMRERVLGELRGFTAG